MVKVGHAAAKVRRTTCRCLVCHLSEWSTLLATRKGSRSKDCEVVAHAVEFWVDHVRDGEKLGCVARFQDVWRWFTGEHVWLT